MSPPLNRSQSLAQLSRPDGFDLAVIGGGATGLAIALQASRAGKTVALVEARDLASGTSSRSTKLLHGGVRYLAQGQVSLVRQALQERARLIKLAPKLTRPLRFVMPAYRWWERALYGTGLVAYDWLSGTASLGTTQYLSRSEVRSLYPQLNPNRLRGAVSYCDAQFDDAGLAIAMARGAAKSGALIVNRVCALKVGLRSEHTIEITIRDEEMGAITTLHCRDAINAAGVWVDALRRAEPIMRPSQGAHIVIARSFFPATDALLLPRTDDGRVLFVVPWLDHCVIGTTDTPREASDLAIGREPLPFSAEIDLILAEAAKVLSPAPKRADVLSAWAGLRPLVEHASRADTSARKPLPTHQISREHSIEIAANGLLTITGGKWTTCLAMARDALRALPHQPIDIAEEIGAPLPDDGPDCAARVPTDSEIVWLANHTWARTVEDILARRSRLLFLNVVAALKAAPEVARALENATGEDPGLDDFMMLCRTMLARFQDV